MKYNVNVEINNISVDNRYYSFDYKVTIDGVVKKEAEYSNDHSWGDDIEYFKGLLKDNYALQIALEHVFNN